MLTKLFVPSKNLGGFDKNKLEKSHIENAGLKKKQNSEIACWATEET